ncbi:MAG: monovalent cation/H+ antiporter complex subunit F [Acidimicrobiales bacterium]
MSWFLVAALVLELALVPCAWVCWRGDAEGRLVGLGLTGTVQVLVLLCLAAGFGEPALGSLAAVLAALSAGATLVFARFLERWI